MCLLEVFVAMHGRIRKISASRLTSVRETMEQEDRSPDLYIQIGTPLWYTYRDGAEPTRYRDSTKRADWLSRYYTKLMLQF